MQRRYGHLEFTQQPFNLTAFREWVQLRFKKIAEALRGAECYDGGNSGTARTLELAIADLTIITLSEATPALTLKIIDTPALKGTTVCLELVQDATGGRVPSWVNATGSAGAVTAPAAGANKKTLYLCVFNGTSWVLSVLASNY